MKKTVFTAAAILLAASCARELPESPKNNENLVAFTIENASGPVMNAVATSDGSKTVLANIDGSVVNWTAGDNAVLFDNSGACTGHLFTGSVQSDPSYINFSGEMDEGATAYWLLYPYNSGASMTDGVITTVLSAGQTAVAGSFADKTALSLASGTRTPGETVASGLSFQNLCPLIAFEMPSYVEGAQSVTLTPNSGTAIAGTISFDASTGAMTAVSGEGSITLNGPLAAGGRYFIAVAPKTYENGFTLTVTTFGSNTYSASTSKTINAAPGKVYYLGTLGLKLDVTPGVTLAHTYSSGSLTGSSATLNIPVASDLAAMIDHWDITLSKGGKTYRSATTNTGVMSVVDGLTYLPEGTYTLACTYVTKDNRSKTLPSVTATIGAPNLSLGAAISHTKNSSNELNGSSATPSVNISTSLASQITWSDIEMRMDSNSGTIVRHGSSLSGTLSVSSSGYVYLPQGDNKYYLSATYTTTADGASHTINGTATSPAPTFTLSTTGYTSYDCYKSTNGASGGATEANTKDGSTIYNLSTRVTIATDLINESKYSKSYTYTYDGTEVSVSGNSATVGNKTGQSWSKHTFSSSCTFDGVTLSSSRDLHVTGLPFYCPVPTSAMWDTNTNGTGTVRFDNDGIYMKSTGLNAYATTKNGFYCPEGIGGQISADMRLYAKSSLAQIQITLSLGKITCARQDSEATLTKAKTVYKSTSKTGTINDGDKIQIKAYSGATGPDATIYNINAIYN